MDCNTCKERETQGGVSRWTHEADMARMERANKRLVIIIFALLIVIGWLVYDRSQWETVETTIEAEQSADNSGSNYIVGGDFGGDSTG